MVSHARKSGDKKGDLRELLDDFEAKIKEAHEALKVEERSRAEAAVATEQQQDGVDGRRSAGSVEGVERAARPDGDAMELDEPDAGAEEEAAPPAAAVGGVRVKAEPGLTDEGAPGPKTDVRASSETEDTVCGLRGLDAWMHECADACIQISFQLDGCLS